MYINRVQSQTGGGDNNVKVETPIMDPASGIYLHDIEVTISCATTGASIYYTIDGTTPTKDSGLYSAPIAIKGNGTTETIKAIAVKEGILDSNIAKESYVINYGIDTSTRYSVTTEHTGFGSVLVTPQSSNGYLDGTVVTIYAIPDNGYYVGPSWIQNAQTSGKLSLNQPSYQFTIHSNTSFSVQFSPVVPTDCSNIQMPTCSNGAATCDCTYGCHWVCPPPPACDVSTKPVCEYGEATCDTANGYQWVCPPVRYSVTTEHTGSGLYWSALSHPTVI